MRPRIAKNWEFQQKPRTSSASKTSKQGAQVKLVKQVVKVRRGQLVRQDLIIEILNLYGPDQLNK